MMVGKRSLNSMKKTSDISVNVEVEEKDAGKKTYWQRFRAKKQKKTPTQAVSIRSLFRYASLIDLLYLTIATIASAVFGVTLPLSVIVFGDALDSFINRATSLCSLNLTSISEQYCSSDVILTPVNFYTTLSSCNFTGSNLTHITYGIEHQLRRPIIMSVIIGCAALLCGYIRVVFFNLSADRQARTIRQILFRSILTKDIAYFDQNQTGELSSQLTANINKIQDGIGEKLDSAVEMMSTFVSGIIIGFSRGWKLSFITLSLSPVIFIAIAILFKVVTKMTAVELKTYGKAGAVAEEVISSIRTVFCYNGQEKGIQRYEEHLDDAKKCGIRKGFVSGLTAGVVFFLLYCSYVLGFSYGARLVWEENYSIGTVFLVFISVSFAVFSLGQASPYFQAIYEARVAAFIVWQTISEPSQINNNSEAGFTKDHLIGDIQFSNVHFAYPSRLDVPILHNLSFHVQSGQTIALVGSSGSGKSTCVQLLQRFYDLQSGALLIDGKPVNQYNLTWLRQHLGVVSQEPVLFHTTIRQNILFGLDSATDQQVYEAAKMANAHDFIMALPQKYETEVGECGSALSGGQKQRIAIARALLQDPKILLLDEATSALDNESEKIVQEALDRAAQGRTTMIIAHRLSTIRNADKIIVMGKGEVIEEGDHETLMMAKGTYYNLVQQQDLRQAEEEGDEAPEILMSEGINAGLHDQPRRRSLAISLTPSVLSALYREKNLNADDDEDENDEGKVSKVKDKKPSTTLALLRMNRPEWISILIGCITCALIGAREPAFCIVQTEIAVAFQECDKDYQKRRITIYILIYVGLGFLSLITHTIRGYVFARSGEAVTKRLRSKAFRAILRQEIAYFDQPEHSTGALCTRLATETSTVQGASGIRFGLIVEYIFAMVIGIIIGFVYSWQLTLLVIVFLPLILFGGMLQIRLTTRFARKNKQIIEDAGKIAMEAIQNIRTVVQLSKENYFEDQYSQNLNTIYQSSRKRVHILGIIFAVSGAVIFFVIAAFLALSAYLTDRGTLPLKNVFMVLNTVVLAARTIGRALTLFPDYGKAIEAAQNIFDLLDRKPAIDNESKDGDEISNFTGELDINGVYFIYPNRPESVILRNFKLNIKPGQKVALVGTSGCGKSTTIQLIERFYDPNIGHLLVDSKDVRSLNLQWYRSQIGIVSQEPVLFDMSIRENIAYGNNSRQDIPLEEIIQAAKDANIHDFIQSLPQGYETNCGTKGTQLSGGQKQRIAIARALIRNPKILLLDEATSALDSESEKIVQEALDRAQQNRTSITIAHRLSTIQNADLICVLHNGVIVESGNHEELMAMGSRYFRMVQGKLK